MRIRVDGSASTLTPSAANSAGYISNTVNIWNGTTYDVFTDEAPYPSTPNLQYFKSFWVNVLPGAYGHTIELLIPAEQSTLSFNQAAPAHLEQVVALEMPWYMGCAVLGHDFLSLLGWWEVAQTVWTTEKDYNWDSASSLAVFLTVT